MLPIKKTVYGTTARDLLAQGVKEVADIVATTAGAAGRTVSISQNWGAPKITKDGVSVAKSVVLSGIKGDGAALVVQAAEKTAKEAGDGTSCSCVLTREILLKGLKEVNHKAKPVYIKRGIDKAVEDVTALIKEASQKVETKTDILNIATISANGDTVVGKLVSDAVMKVGDNGTVMVENSPTDKDYLELIDGLSFDQGWISPYFVNNAQKQTCVLEKPLILLYDGRLTSIKDMTKLLEGVITANRSLLIVCDEVEPDVLQTLVLNVLRGGCKWCVVKAPAIGDFRTGYMEDIALLTNGTYFSSDMGVELQNITVDQLGTASSVIVSDKDTIIRQDPKDMTEETKKAVSDRIEMLKGLIENSESSYIEETAKERLAKLSGGIALIRVGGMTEAEVNEKKDRVDDAICATKSAKEEGIVVGGGICLYNIYLAMKDKMSDRNSDIAKKLVKMDIDEVVGYKLLVDSLIAPMRQIIENTGNSFKQVLKDVTHTRKITSSKSIGYDAMNGKVTDLKAVGVVDSAKVIRCALKNSASIAGTILTVNGVVTNDLDTMGKINEKLGH